MSDSETEPETPAPGAELPAAAASPPHEEAAAAEPAVAAEPAAPPAAAVGVAAPMAVVAESAEGAAVLEPVAEPQLEPAAEPQPEPAMVTLPPPPPRPGRRWFVLLYVVPVMLAFLWIALPLIRGTKTLYMRDVLNAHLEMKWAEMRALRQGYFPLVDPYRGGGEPLAGNPNGAPFYPTTALFLWTSPFWALNAHFWIHLLLAPFAFYWMARRFGLGREAAWAAAACYAACGFFLSHLSFYNLIAGAALAPALVAACLAVVQSAGGGAARAPAGPWRGALYVPAVAVLWALMMFGGDPLLVVMAGALAAAALAADSWRRPVAWRGLVQVAAALVCGTLIALPQIEEFLRILPVSFRGVRGYTPGVATIASWSPVQAAEWLLPTLFGRLDVRQGGTFWAAPYFTGAPPLFPSLYPGLLALALVAAAGWPRGRAAWWAWVGAAAGIFCSLGRYNPVMQWLFNRAGAGAMRYPVKFWLPVAVGASLVCGLGFERVLAAGEAGGEGGAGGAAGAGAGAAGGTGAVGTGAAETGAVGTGAVGTGAVGTGAVGTGAVGTGAVGTGAAETGAVGTGAAGTEAAGTEAAGTGAVASGTAAGGARAARRGGRWRGPAGAARRFRWALGGLTLVLGGAWLTLSLAPGPVTRILRRIIPAERTAAFVANERLRWAGLCLFSLVILFVFQVLARRMARSPRGAWTAGALLLGVHAVSQVFLLQALYPTDPVAPYRVPPPALAWLPPGMLAVNPDFEHLFGQPTFGAGKFPSDSLMWLERRAFAEMFPFAGPLWDRRFDLNESPEGLDSYYLRLVQGALPTATDEQRTRMLAGWGVDRIFMERPLAPTPHARLLAELPSFGQTLHIYEVLGRSPEVFLARRVWLAPHMNAAFDAMRAASFDPQTDVVMPGKGVSHASAGGTVRILDEGPESLDLDIDVEPGGSVLVVQRTQLIYRAAVDGRRVPLLVANLFRNGLPVPAGRHRVRLWVDRTNFHRAVAAAVAALAALPLLAVWGARRRIAAPAGSGPLARGTEDGQAAGGAADGQTVDGAGASRPEGGGAAADGW